MKLTTKKISAGNYAVLLDGRATNLTIEKGAPPAYRQRQEWFVCPANKPGDIHFETRGKDDALEIIRDIMRDLGLTVEAANG